MPHFETPALHFVVEVRLLATTRCIHDHFEPLPSQQGVVRTELRMVVKAGFAIALVLTAAWVVLLGWLVFRGLGTFI